MSQEKETDNGMGETETLLDYVEVAGFKVKPWTIVQLAELSPYIEKIMNGLKERGITLEGLKTGVGLDRVLFAVLPEAPRILEITLRISKEELEKISFEKVPAIVLTILQLNIEYLKNSLSPIQGMIKKILA
jgi:hypothetical protein